MNFYRGRALLKKVIKIEFGMPQVDNQSWTCVFIEIKRTYIVFLQNIEKPYLKQNYDKFSLESNYGKFL